MAGRSCLFVAMLLTASTANAADVSAEAGVVSDYRYRGLSLSGHGPALQGMLSVEHEAGAYGSLWASSINSSGNGLKAELSATAGYAAELAEGFGLDLSASYFLYPDDSGSNYAEFTGIASTVRGDLSAGLGISLVPKQAGPRDEAGKHRNSYVFGDAEFAVPGTNTAFKAGVGYERGYFDEAERGGKLDWSVGVEIEAAIKAGLSYNGYRTRYGSGGGLVASVSFGL